MPIVRRLLILLLAPLPVLMLCGSSLGAPARPDIDLQVKIREALNSRIEIAQLSSRITQLVSRGTYREAERLLDELLISKRMSDDGHRVLEIVYFQLAIMEQLRIWNRWCEARPSSHYPFTVRGMYYLERARFLDGANQTLLLTEKQREEFNRSLINAQADLQKAFELTDRDPGPAAALTSLSIHLKLPRSEMEKWFDNAYKFDPYWLGTYRAKLLYLAPWWYGSDQLMEDFAHRCFVDDLPGSNTYIVALDYHKLRSDRLGKGRQGEQYLLDPVVYRTVSTGLKRFQDDYPRSPRMETYRRLHERAIARPEVAIDAFSRNLQSNSKDPQARKGRILAYLKNKQFKQAAADLKRLEKLQGETPFSLVNRGKIALQDNRDVDRGHHYFEQAIAQETSSYRRKLYLFERGEIYRLLGKYRLAISDYSEAIREDPLFEEAYYGRAQSKYELDDTPGALADLTILKSSIKGRLSTKARTLSNSYLKKEVKYTGGSRSENSALERILRRHELTRPQEEKKDSPDQDHREFMVSGLHHFYQGDYQQARRDFYRVLSRDFSNPRAYYMLGLIGTEHEFDQVESCIFFKQAYREAPETPDYLISVSRCLYRERNFSTAIEQLSNFLNREDQTPMDDQTAAQIYFLRGLCLEESGLMPEALKDMRKAYELNPSLKAAGLFVRDHSPKSASETVERSTSSPPAMAAAPSQNETTLKQLYEEGQLKLIEGDIGGAKISFLKAIRLNPEASAAYHQLGRLYFEHEKNYYKARLYYSQAIERNSQIAYYYFDRAAIHFYFKQYDLAREDFNRVLELQPDHQRSLYYRGVCNHYLGETDAARLDFQMLRQSDQGWDIEIERFRNAWRAEVDQFLDQSW